METTTHSNTSSTDGFFRRIKERIQQRKRRIRRAIELARLRRIRRNTTPRYSHCMNCGTPLQGMYCHRCGQYALDIYQPMWKYVRQYFENVYQFDGKIWMTLRLMFTRPGFLTTEFNAGKINSYMHPFRLYMCISVVFFAVFFMLAEKHADDFNVINTEISSGVIRSLKQGTDRRDTTVYLYQAPLLARTLAVRYRLANADSLVRYQLLDSEYGLARTTLPRLLADSCLTPTALADKDLKLIREAKRGLHETEAMIEDHTGRLIVDEEDEADVKATYLAFRDFRIDTLQLRTAEGRDTLLMRPQTVYRWSQWQTDETKMLKNNQMVGDIMGGLSKWTPFYLMFLLPVFGGMLSLFYRSQRMPYMWHFAHAVHLNTVFLLLLCLPLVPTFAYGIDEVMARGATLTAVKREALLWSWRLLPVLMFAYLLVSFRTVYRQGWLKTTVKAVLFSASFTLLAGTVGLVLFARLLAEAS